MTSAQDAPRAPVVLTTLGHGHRSQADLLALLRGAGLLRLVDVRRYPASRRHPHMNRDSLAAALAEGGVEYRHAESLGGYRQPRPDSLHDGLDDEALRGYADHMETPVFRRALAHLLELAAQRPTAVMCAESAPTHCHRALLSDACVNAGARVVHLLDATHRVEHVLHPRARRRPDGALHYRAPDAFQLGLFAADGS